MGMIFGLVLGVPKMIVVLLLLGLLAGGIYCAPGWVEKAQQKTDEARGLVDGIKVPGSEADISIEGEYEGTGVGIAAEKQGDTLTLTLGKTVIPPGERYNGLRASASIQVRTPTPTPPEPEALVLWSANTIEGEDLPVIEIETGKVFQIRVLFQMDNGTYRTVPVDVHPGLAFTLDEPDRFKLDTEGKILAPYQGQTILSASAGNLAAQAKVVAKGGTTPRDGKPRETGD